MRRESRRNERLKERKTLEGKRKRIQGKRGSSRCLLSWLDSSIGAQFFQHLIVFLCLFYSFFRKASFTYVRFLRFSPPSPTPDPLGRYGASRPEALEAIPRHRGESFGIPLASHFILAPPCGREPFYLYLSYSLSLSLSFFLFVSVSPFFSFCFSFFRILSVHRASLGVLLFCPTLSVYSRFSSLWILHPRRSLSYPPVWRLVRARPMDGDAGVLAWYPMVAMLRSTEGVQKVRGNCTTQLGRCRTSLRPNKILTALCPNPRNCPSFRTRSFTIARNDLSLYFRNSRHKLRVHVQIKSGYFLSKEIFNFGRAK